MMTDAELLEKVKAGLGTQGTYNDPVLLPKVLAVKSYMLNAGITAEQIEGDLGIACLTIGVNDIWNMASGELKFSSVFNTMAFQLQVVSIPDV
jgi:hypothetical protein